LHGVEDVATRKINRRGPLERELDDFRLAGGDHRADHQRHVAAGQVVGLQRLGADFFFFIEAGLHGHDLAADDHRRVHLAEPHPHQIDHADAGPRHDRLDPQPREAGEDRQEDQHEDQAGDGQDKPQRSRTE
jgi:hypothetical protein